MGQLSRRDKVLNLAATVGIAGLGLLAIGCGKQANTAANTAAAPAAPLTVWHSDFTTETVESVAEGLKSDTTTVTAKKIDSNYEWRLINSIAADGPPDVMLMPNDFIPDHKDKLVTIPADYIKPAKDGSGAANTKVYFQDTYLDLASSQLLNKDGTAIAFPGPIKELKLFINRKLFGQASERWRQANPGKDAEFDAVRKTLSKPIVTWNDFAGASQLITQKTGSTIVIAGAALGMAKNIEQAQDVYELMAMQQGGQITDSTKLVALFQNYEKNADGRLIYPGKDALRYFSSYANPSSPNYSWTADFSSARQAFLDGRVAMIFDYGEFTDTVKQKGKDTVDLEVGNVPQVTADGDPVVFVRYYAVGISKGSTQKSKSGTLARLLSSDKMSELVRGLPESTSPLKKDAEAAEIARLAQAKPVFKRHHAEFDNIMNEMLDDVALRAQNPDNAVDRAAERINQLLNRDE